MPVRVYEYAKCSTCRKALKFLEGRGVEFTAVPIVETPPSRAELKTMLGHVDSLKKLFNTSGEMYRELKLSEKLPALSESEALDLLARNGKLIKRPFVLTGKTGLVGFDEAAWKKAFPKG